MSMVECPICGRKVSPDKLVMPWDRDTPICEECAEKEQAKND